MLWSRLEAMYGSKKFGHIGKQVGKAGDYIDRDSFSLMPVQSTYWAKLFRSSVAPFSFRRLCSVRVHPLLAEMLRRRLGINGREFVDPLSPWEGGREPKELARSVHNFASIVRSSVAPFSFRRLCSVRVHPLLAEMLRRRLGINGREFVDPSNPATQHTVQPMAKDKTSSGWECCLVATARPGPAC